MRRHARLFHWLFVNRSVDSGHNFDGYRIQTKEADKRVQVFRDGSVELFARVADYDPTHLKDVRLGEAMLTGELHDMLTTGFKYVQLLTPPSTTMISIQLDNANIVPMTRATERRRAD